MLEKNGFKISEDSYIVFCNADISEEEWNEKLNFDRKTAHGKRLNIPSGTAVRFEPGQTRDVDLIEIQGKRKIFGFNKKIMGSL